MAVTQVAVDKLEERVKEIIGECEMIEIEMQETKDKGKGLVPPFEEAARSGAHDPEALVVIAKYWQNAEKLQVKWDVKRELEKQKEVLSEAMKQQNRDREAAAKREGGKGVGGEERWGKRKLDYKAFTHMKDVRFTGKDGGTGWVNFFDDMMVALGSVDKELEEKVQEVTNMKDKELGDAKEVKHRVGPEVWEKYSGEFFCEIAGDHEGRRAEAGEE